MIRKSNLSLLAVFIFGCASSSQQQAVNALVVSDSIVTSFVRDYDEFVDRKISECGSRLNPNVNSKKDAQECLGLASSRDAEVAAEIVRSIVDAQSIAAGILMCAKREGFSGNCSEDELRKILLTIEKDLHKLSVFIHEMRK